MADFEQTQRNRLCRAAGVAPLRGSGAAASGVGQSLPKRRKRSRSSTRTPPYSTPIRPAACSACSASLTRWRDRPDQVAQLLLRDAQQAADAGVEHRMEQRRQAARDAAVGVGHAVDLARADELAEPLVQLLRDEAVEGDAALDQPVEGLDAQARHHALAQRLDVVAVGLALDHRALAEPAAGRHAGEGDGDAHRGVVAHLQQAVDDAEPVGHRPADAAQQFAGADLHHLEVAQGALALVVLQCAQPGDALEFGRRQRRERATAGAARAGCGWEFMARIWGKHRASETRRLSS